MDFKIGDVVRIYAYSYGDSWVRTSETGTIYMIEEDSQWAGGFGVALEPHKEPHICIKALRHDRVKATRLAKKLYPDNKMSECGEWLYGVY